ncbi:MAG TPA: hypothetical protein VFJ30_05265, partial [Phycisphaerae bacterium]|nr:hypothetical protein [Phycisphaerae bacterium]
MGSVYSKAGRWYYKVRCPGQPKGSYTYFPCIVGGRLVRNGERWRLAGPEGHLAAPSYTLALPVARYIYREL